MLKKRVVFLVLVMSIVTFSWFEITYAEEWPSWVMTDNFVPPEGAKRATGNFSGTLSFTTTQMNVTPDWLLESDYRYPWYLWYTWWYPMDLLAEQDPAGAVPLFDLDATLFPGLEVQFFTTKDGDLVPVQRGIIRKPVKDRTESFWEIIVGPGKAWKDNKSKEERWKGWNKAAFPFSLVQSQEGEALIGLAFFYYKGHEVSKLYFQVSNDTAGGFIFWDDAFNMTAWGEVDITYTPGTIKKQKALKKAFKKEVVNRLPMKPLSELEGAAGMGGDVNQDNVLTMAMLVDGVIYNSPINTPFGEYPYLYLPSMRVGVWSASKSLIPGMAALRLAQKYGTDFLDTFIVDYFKDEEFDYVSSEAEARWKMVKIRHALHMTTGMGPAGYDPNWAWYSTNTYLWSYSYDLADCIWYYFNQGPVPDDEVTGPGQKFYYMDQDMWIATLAMERFLQKQEGPDATILNMLIEEVYKPIGVDHFATGTGYTETGEPGFPFSAWGVLPTIDYLAKAGRLIANMGATEDGVQILDRDLVEDFFTNSEYQLAFWKNTFTNGSGTFYIPRMSGAGGNYVFSMPNGLVGIALGYNSYNFGWDTEQQLTIVEAANEIRPF